MRKLIATVVLVVGAAVAAPFAASPAARTGAVAMEHQAVVADQRRTPSLTGLRDEAAMVLLGTALIGLGAAVRRTL
jgi:hypothetical protein